ncbi:MAG TPA: PEP-CTERM sorting domain-containing protein [Terriglobales bacterium]|nr:PEP-CTERM sorting domain-containing protein [Terriglobales bacterium]
MNRSTGPRTTANLSESIHHQLNMYEIAAVAAGVGLMVCAQLADAKIVYTPANVHINPNAGMVKLDLNHDGINDFQFSAASELTQGGFFRSSLVVVPVQQANRVGAVHTRHGYICAAALAKGRTVGPHTPFQRGPSHLTMARVSGETGVGSASLCPWVDVRQAYLGLKFVVKGKIHFGWARIKMIGGLGFPAVITGYAYETIPNKSIVTGKTKGPDEISVEGMDSARTTPESGTLGALAIGAPGLAIWRRKETALAGR